MKSLNKSLVIKSLKCKSENLLDKEIYSFTEKIQNKYF